jgi:hypothetical protein
VKIYTFKEGVTQLSEEPIWRVERTESGNKQSEKLGKTLSDAGGMFQPGVTYFFPLVDITVELINVYFWLYDMGT